MSCLLPILQAYARCLFLLQTHPNSQPLQSCKAQLEYLQELVDGGRQDIDRLNDIILGRYAAGEFESLDMGFAEMLYAVEDVVKILKTEHRC
ncbi:immunity protein Tsi6 family protein [Ideonella sp.]|jgi:hypothetical protein|uniref:immunity protein Tsi6 family protein n=1 Tax=Ideonella sp. TaxID=1929293 RepID=UPI0037C07179